MGLPSIEQATVFLINGGLVADLGNPGEIMPHMNRPLVAVNLLESTDDVRSMIAYVCGPMSQGRITCENVANAVAAQWRANGAKCQWGECSFDGKAAMHIVKVVGTWTK